MSERTQIGSADAAAAIAFRRHRRRRHERNRGAMPEARDARQRLRSETFARRSRGWRRSVRKSARDIIRAHLKDDGGLDAVVISSAVKFSNPEVARARETENPGDPAGRDAGRVAADGEAGRRGRGHAWQDDDDRADRADHGRGGTRSDRRGRRKYAQHRHQRAPRARRFHGGRGRRERRLVSAAAADDRGGDEHRSGASRSLRHDGPGARGVFELHQPGPVLRRGGARHRQRQRARAAAVGAQADGDLRGRAGRRFARRENRDRRTFDALRGDSQRRSPWRGGQCRRRASTSR